MYWSLAVCRGRLTLVPWVGVSFWVGRLLGASEEGLNSMAKGFGVGVQTRVRTGGRVHPWQKRVFAAGVGGLGSGMSIGKEAGSWYSSSASSLLVGLLFLFSVPHAEMGRESGTMEDRSTVASVRRWGRRW